MEWTTGQDEVLRECSYRGAAYAAAELERRFGVRRSVDAVKMRASRIHCSLAERTVCPQCGAVGVTLNAQSGMCRRCTEEMHVAEERAFAELLERERAEREDPEALAALRRERDRLRQRNSRTCRRYGLDSRKARKALKGGMA